MCVCERVRACVGESPYPQLMVPGPGQRTAYP